MAERDIVVLLLNGPCGIGKDTLTKLLLRQKYRERNSSKSLSEQLYVILQSLEKKDIRFIDDEKDIPFFPFKSVHQFAFADEAKHRFCSENPSIDAERFRTDRSYKEAHRGNLIKFAEACKENAKDPHFWAVCVCNQMWDVLEKMNASCVKNYPVLFVISDYRFIGERKKLEEAFLVTPGAGTCSLHACFLDRTSFQKNRNVIIDQTTAYSSPVTPTDCEWKLCFE